IDELKQQLNDNENEYSIIQKQFHDAQSLNYEFKKQIEQLQLDVEQQLKTIEQFKVLIFLIL
ncbi:unnamed protein product, partial [Rotaria magnacalcarata]